MHSNRFYYVLIFIAAALFLFSCKKGDALSKTDRQKLFLAPSLEEIDHVWNEWNTRDLSPTEYSVIREDEIANGKFKLRMVSFKVNGSKEYGALLIPETIVPVPVRMYVGGFGLNITTNSVNLVVDDSGAGNAFILAIPALRGQSLELTINGTLYNTPVSEGDHCDAFDGATDDVITFLNLIQQTETLADVYRTSVRGGSRGCTVALLAGIRDKRIKRVVGVAGPVDLVELTYRNENDPTYQCQFLDAYKNGQSSTDQARNKMIASSPLYFTEHLPLTQLHLGIKDRIVPFYQGYYLQQEMIKLGMESNFQLFLYDKTHEDIATNNVDLRERIELFLSQL